MHWPGTIHTRLRYSCLAALLVTAEGFGRLCCAVGR